MLTYKIYFVAVLTKTFIDAAIVSSPGVIKREVNEINARFRWSLSKPFDANDPFNLFTIYTGDSADPVREVLKYAGGPSGGRCTLLSWNVLCINEGTQVGFTITNIQNNNATRYTILVELGLADLDRHTDNNAVLYLLKSPTQPTVTGNLPTPVNQTLTLVCHSSSQSLPGEFQDQAVIEYTWSSRAFVVTSGISVTVGPLRREDNGATVTCTANEQGSSLRVDNHNTLNVTYGPHKTFLSNPGPITVTEGDHVTITCTSVCSPVCSYQWTRSGDPSWSHDGHVMDKSDINRDRHDTYTCRAYNGYGSRNVTVKINVNYEPAIVTFGPTAGNIHGETETMICEVTSRPQSVIDIRNTSTELVRSEGYQAVYTFRPVSVLDSGLYQCGAGNDTGHRAVRDIMLDIKGGFHLCSNQSASVIRVRGLSSNITEEICQFANPFLEVTEANWTFVPGSISLQSDWPFPDDTYTTTGSTHHKYRKLIKLHITRVSEGHFGKYTLKTSNSNGPEVVFTLVLVHEEPIVVHTDLVSTRTTAVSIYLQWWPGFDGGYEQTFWIQLTITDTGDTWWIYNISDSRENIMQFKLTSEHGIQPSETYRIQIGAHNIIGKTPGPSTTTSTKAQPQFLGENPDVRIEDSKAYITWPVSHLDSVTHVMVRSCDPDEVDNCVHTNVTDPSTQPYVISLPEASSFTFWFDFYDGVDVVYSPPPYVHVQGPNSVPGVVAGAVTAFTVVVVAVIVGVLIWRKRHIKNDNKQSQTVLYENVIGSSETRSPPEGSQQENVTYEEITSSKKDLQAPKDATYEEIHDQTLRWRQEDHTTYQTTATYDGLQPRLGGAVQCAIED